MSLCEGLGGSRVLGSLAGVLLGSAVGDGEAGLAAVGGVGAAVELAVAGAGCGGGKVGEGGAADEEGAGGVAGEGDGLDGFAEGAGEGLEVGAGVGGWGWGGDWGSSWSLAGWGVALVVVSVVSTIVVVVIVVVVSAVVSSIVVVVVVVSAIVVVVVSSVIIVVVVSRRSSNSTIRSLSSKVRESNASQEVSNRLTTSIDWVVERSRTGSIDSISTRNSWIDLWDDSTKASGSWEGRIRADAWDADGEGVEVLFGLDEDLCGFESSGEWEGSYSIGEGELFTC